MKNIAKCKLCNSIIESFHTYDYVTCKCGEISITGGTERLECSAKDWVNFLRVDDNGNEIIVKVKDQANEAEAKEPSQSLNKKDKIEMLEAMIKGLENLPTNAMSTPINHYDLFSYMAVILSILKEE